jgi:hypothetical protein
MTRTESDIRTAYADPAGVDAAERRLLDSIADLGPVPATAHRRPPLRTWAAVAASVAAVTAVTTTVAVAVPHLLANPSPREPAGQPLASAPATPGTRPPAAPARVPVTPQVAVRTMLDLLPRQGSVSHLAGRSSRGWSGGELIYDDGHGAAQLTVGVDYPYTYQGTLQRQAAGSLCSSEAVLQLHEPCSTLPDGSQVATYQGDANVPGGATEWAVDVLRADGVNVQITEWNAPQEKDATPTRSSPPFTVAELETIARSGKWQATVSSATAARAAGLFVPDHA